MNAPFRASGRTQLVGGTADYSKTAVTEAANNPAAHYRKRSDRPLSPADVEQQLDLLIAQWRHDTAWLADPCKMVSHPTAVALVDFIREEGAQRLVVERLHRTPSYLVLILQEVTGELPYRDGDVGQIGAMARRWVEWQLRCDEAASAVAAE